VRQGIAGAQTSVGGQAWRLSVLTDRRKTWRARRQPRLRPGVEKGVQTRYKAVVDRRVALRSAWRPRGRRGLAPGPDFSEGGGMVRLTSEPRKMIFPDFCHKPFLQFLAQEKGPGSFQNPDKVPGDILKYLR
jgi:hypothetical protein